MLYKVYNSHMLHSIACFIARVQNICNLIGWEEHSIEYVVLLIWIMYSLTNKTHTTTIFDYHGTENRNLLLKNKLVINY